MVTVPLVSVITNLTIEQLSFKLYWILELLNPEISTVCFATKESVIVLNVENIFYDSTPIQLPFYEIAVIFQLFVAGKVKFFIWSVGFIYWDWSTILWQFNMYWPV